MSNHKIHWVTSKVFRYKFGHKFGKCGTNAQAVTKNFKLVTCKKCKKLIEPPSREDEK